MKLAAVDLTIAIICFGFLCLLLLASLIPLKPRPWKRLQLFLPFLSLGVFVLYQSRFSVEMNIRVDLLVVLPLLVAIFLVGFLRWGFLIYQYAKGTEGGPKLVAIVLMEVLLLVLVAACYFHYK